MVAGEINCLRAGKSEAPQQVGAATGRPDRGSLLSAFGPVKRVTAARKRPGPQEPVPLCALLRETGDHAPEVVHFPAKLPVLTDQALDHCIELVLPLCGLSQPVEHALHVLEPADELRGKV